MTHSHARVVVVLLLASLLAGCAAGRAFRRADSAARAGDWDTAVEFYRQAVQEDPDNAVYRIALERASISASIAHLDQARVLEARGQLSDALREYRRASELDPPNRQVAAKVIELERRIRAELESQRPPTMQQLRETARQVAGPPPLMNLNSVAVPLRFNNASLRDILNFLGQASGINVTFESTFTDRTYSVQLENVTLAEALQQILSANQLFYKVVNQSTILVIPDNPQKRAQYEEQVVQTFFVSHTDALELAQFINTIVRLPGAQTAAPTVVGNKTANTVTARATASVMDIIERLIDSNDTPRAEVVIDVQILEVSRSRTKELGLDLGNYALSAVFSPESRPEVTDGGLVAPPFNANTISRGVSTADFYMTVPSAIVRFLESDSDTKVVAKPQLRGAEGVQLKLNLGEEVPILQTAFTPIAQGGANFNPLQSFNYRPVGVRVEMTPRVTYEGEVVLDLYVENSTLGPGIEVAGQSVPTFFSRNVTTRLRLREGESTLLAGLLQDEERRSLRGFPGLLRIPVIRQLFSASNTTIEQTDIVMLLTPRVVRTHELTPQDLAPIYIGTQTNLGLGGPPPLIAVSDPGPAPDGPVAAPVPPAPGAPVAPGVLPPAPVPQAPGGPPVAPGPTPVPGLPPGGAGAPAAGLPTAGVPVVPPGSTQVPGTTAVPAAAVAAGAASGQILVTPPSTDLRVGAGPYTVPIQITGASQVSSVSVTVTYNPAVLRLRATTEGSFMRTGGVAATVTQQPDAAAGRIDIAIVRTGDVTGVAGTGLLAALLFDAVGAGPANLAVTATAASPGGSPVPLQYAPITAVTVR